MRYRGITFHPFYIKRKATEAEIAMHHKVERRRKLAVELDFWVRSHADVQFNISDGTTAHFVGWAIENRQGKVVAVVRNAHEFIDSFEQAKLKGASK